jgi:putative FmdB family regulatory protein
MPIYEYRCENGHDFEAFQSMSDEALDTCEVCGAPAQRRLSAPAIHYKGSGFYTTDYARKGAKKPVESGGSSGDSGSKKDSGSGGDSGSGSGSGSKSGESAKAGSSSGSSGSSSSGSSSSGSKSS